METGRGKTFISIMLMADLLGIDITNNINFGKRTNNQEEWTS